MPGFAKTPFNYPCFLSILYVVQNYFSLIRMQMPMGNIDPVFGLAYFPMHETLSDLRLIDRNEIR